MNWDKYGLELIRATGVLSSVLAGIAALFTDGAFQRREPPLSGRWKEFPFARYRVTPWGGVLLAVIIAAPTVQFIGDYYKDKGDDKTLTDTATYISSHVSNFVDARTAELAEKTAADTKEATGQIVDIVKKASDKQIAEVDASVHEQHRMLELVDLDNIKLSF